MVVVRAAARGVHGRGRHGVKGEDELFTVAHAGRLGVVTGDTLQVCSAVPILVKVRLLQGVCG